MKKIMIPVAVVVLILAIVAIILSKTSPSDLHNHSSDNEIVAEYHTHENGEIHYGAH